MPGVRPTRAGGMESAGRGAEGGEGVQGRDARTGAQAAWCDEGEGAAPWANAGAAGWVPTKVAGSRRASFRCGVRPASHHGSPDGRLPRRTGRRTLRR